MNLLQRAALLSLVRDQMDDAMVNGAANVHKSWLMVDDCYKTSHCMEKMTPEELSAAYVNAPKGF